MPRIARVIALLAVGSFGGCSCEPPTTLADIAVERASLSDLFFMGLGIFGSLRTGTAALHLEDTAGESFDVDVKIHMTVSGGMMEMSMATINGGEGDYDLSRIDAPVGTDLLGAFEGLALNAGMLVGGGLLNLENERHAEVTVAGLEGVLGMSFIAGHAWAGIEVAPENECGDGIDDDLDGTIDCDDADCDDVDPCDFVDAGPPPDKDAGEADAGDGDAGDSDAGDTDAGGTDADAGESDAGVADAGDG